MMDGLPVAEFRREARLEPQQVPQPERLRAVEEGRELAIAQLDRLLVDFTRIDVWETNGFWRGRMGRQLGPVGTGLNALLDHPLVSGDREPIAVPRGRHVEQPAPVRRHAV